MVRSSAGCFLSDREHSVTRVDCKFGECLADLTGFVDPKSPVSLGSTVVRVIIQTCKVSVLEIVRRLLRREKIGSRKPAAFANGSCSGILPEPRSHPSDQCLPIA